VSPDHNTSLDVVSSYSVGKVGVVIFQLGFACGTLYGSRGAQLEWYEYATFSLTVIPYIIMSFINLVRNLATPDYPNIVHGSFEAMEEARGRGGQFGGTIGISPISPINNGETSPDTSPVMP
jgi:hypothetical protein